MGAPLLFKGQELIHHNANAKFYQKTAEIPYYADFSGLSVYFWCTHFSACLLKDWTVKPSLL